MKLVLLNGPPRCGKDTAAKAIISYIEKKALADPERPPHVVLERFSMPIKRAFAGMIDAEIDAEGNVLDYEPDKDKIIPLLGMSYRRWQILFSESFMKPLISGDIFGRLLLSRIEALPLDSVVVVPDCGFQIEVEAVLRSDIFHEGKLRAFLVQVYRPGCTFAGDSRRYISHPHIRNVVIQNDGTKAEFEVKACMMYDELDREGARAAGVDGRA
jgi:hypothetical protein